MARQEVHARGQDALLASLRSCAPVRHVRLTIAPLENDGVNNIPIQYFTKRKWEEVLPCTSQQLYFNGRVLRARRSGGFRMSDLNSASLPELKRTKSEPTLPLPTSSKCDTETTQRLLELREQLRTLTGVPENLEIPALGLIKQVEQLEDACEILDLGDLDDDIFYFVIKSIVEPTMSFKRCSTFLRCFVSPKVQKLEHMASRLLFKSLSTVAAMHPGPLIEGLLLPLMADSNTGSAQVDVINRILKECFPAAMVLNFLRTFLSHDDAASAADLDTSFSQTQERDVPVVSDWTEHTLSVLDNILSMKLPLPDQLFQLLLSQLDTRASFFSTTLPFSSLLLLLITKHAEQVAANKEAVKQIAAKCNNFMVKGIQVKLAKM